MSAPQRAYSLLNMDFSAALEANNKLCSLVGWPTDIVIISDKYLTFCFDFDGMTQDPSRKFGRVPGASTKCLN